MSPFESLPGILIFLIIIGYCLRKVVEAAQGRRRRQRKDYNAILRCDDSLMRRL